MNQEDREFLDQLALDYYSNTAEIFFQLGLFVLLFIVVLKFYRNVTISP